MSDQMTLVVLNIALTGFTGILAWFLKELWALWRESAKHREKMQEHLHALEKSMIESGAILREMVAELRLELAKDYVPMVEFKEFREDYVRPQMHDIKERVNTLEAKGLYAGKKL